MALNLKEYVRESLGTAFTKIKSKMYVKEEVDAAIAAKNGTNINLDGYTIPASTGAVGTNDPIQTAIGKLEKGLESATAGGGDVNVQSDWNITDPGSDAFIKNKPDLSIYATTTDYSTTVEMNAAIQASKDEILGGASAAYDTLKEIQTELEGDDTSISGLLSVQGTQQSQLDTLTFTTITNTELETDWNNA